MPISNYDDVDNLIWGSWSRKGRICRVTPADIEAVEREDKLWFPVALTPEGEHDLVAKLGKEARRELQLRAAHRALLAGIRYEETIVDPACDLLKWDALGMGLGDLMRDRANLIKEQEAGHSGDMFRTLRGLEDRMRFPRAPEPPPLPGSMTRLHDTDDLMAWHDLVWRATMIETAISRVLAEVRGDKDVVPCVQGSFEWHMRDEATHGAYFTDLIAAFWPKLPKDIRRHLAPRLAGHIRDFLEPDLSRIHTDLILVGLMPEDAARAVADAYPEVRVRRDMRRAAQHTIGCLKAAGAFEDGARRGLEDAGLIDP